MPDLNQTVGLDISAFKSGATQLAAQVKNIETSFRASAAQMDNWSGTSNGLKERVTSLQEKLGLQRQELEKLTSAYKQTVQEQGADSKSAQSLASQMFNVEKQIESTQKGITKYSAELKTAEKQEKENSSSLSRLKSSFSGLADQSQKSTSNVKEHFSGLKSSIAGAVAGIGLSLGVTGLVKSIYGVAESASDLVEAQNVVESTFKTSSKAIEDWSNTTAASAGISKTASTQWVGFMGAMLKSSGVTESASASMSEKLVQLTGDLSSFYNIGTSDMWEKIRAGMSGETKPLKDLGINMDEANLSAFALSEGITTSYKKMSQGEQTTLRYNYLLKVTKDAQGDFAKTSSNSMANQARIFQMNIDSMKQSVGSSFLPMVNGMFNALNPMIQQAIPAVSAGFKTMADNISAHKEDIVSAAKSIWNGIKDVGKVIGDVVSAAKPYVAPIISDIGKIASDLFPTMTKSAKDMGSQIGGVVKTALGDVKGILDWMAQHGEIVKGALIGIAAGFAAIKTATAITGTISKVKEGIDGLSGAAKGAKIFENLFGMSPQVLLVVGIIAAVAALAFVIIKNWGPISDFFKNLWNKIISVFKPNMITNAFNSAIAPIKGAWNAITGFFGGIFNSIKSVFKPNLISNGFKSAADGAKNAWNGIQGFFGGIWNNIISTFKPDMISNAFKSAWSGIQGAWNGAAGWFGGVWNGIKGEFQPDTISNAFKSAWGGIQGAWSGAQSWFGGVWEGIRGHFQPDMISNGFSSAWGGIQGAWGNAGSWFGGIWNSIKSGFSALNPMQWGRDLIDNLANGIRDAANHVKQAVGNVAQNIRNFLHFSKPDEGPLADFDTYMPDMMTMMANGITENVGKLKSAAYSAAGAISSGLSVSANMIPAYAGGYAAAPSVSNPVTNHNYYGPRQEVTVVKVDGDVIAGAVRNRVSRSIQKEGTTVRGALGYGT